MKKSAVLIVALLVSGSAAAQMSDRFSDYFEGPEGFLMTKDERKAWKNVTSNAGAKEFIELFWAKRDPDLSTAINEFRLDFNQIVEAADRHFTYESTRGALSDRARVLILLGQYSRMDRRPPGAFASGVIPPGARTTGPSRMVPSASLYQNQGATEIWEYRSEDLPVRVAQYFVHAVFLETEVDDNDFILERSNATLMHVLGKMPEVLMVNPDLTEVPQIGLIPGSRPASDDEMRWFSDDPRPWPDTAPVFATAGLAPGPRHFIWAHLYVGEGISDLTSVIGRVRNSDSGEEFGTFAVPAQEAVVGERALELSVPVGEGRWMLDVALARDTGPLAVGTFSVTTTRTPRGGTFVSPFVCGSNSQPVRDSKPGDPFNIGGWKVVPLLDSRFSTPTVGQLSYMAYVFEPELDPDGNPQFNVSISLSKDGQVVASTQPQPAPLSKLGDGVWMFGRGLPLERFTEPGSYNLRVELEQTTDGANGVVEIPFEMVEKDSEGEGS